MNAATQIRPATQRAVDRAASRRTADQRHRTCVADLGGRPNLRPTTIGAVATVECRACARACTLKPSRNQLNAWCQEEVTDAATNRKKNVYWCEDCGPRLYREVA